MGFLVKEGKSYNGRNKGKIGVFWGFEMSYWVLGVIDLILSI